MQKKKKKKKEKRKKKKEKRNFERNKYFKNKISLKITFDTK